MVALEPEGLVLFGGGQFDPDVDFCLARSTQR
jgi:hypothetical protein